MARSRTAKTRDAGPGRPPPDGRRPWSAARLLDFAAVFAVAFLVRMLVWLQIRSMPIVRTPILDSLEYLEWARRIAAGDFTWPAPPPHGPGYPYFLGFVLSLSGGSLAAAAVAQALVGAAGCVLVAALGRRYFGRAAGLLAGLLLAVYGVVAFFDVSLYSEGLLLTLLSGALLLLPPDERSMALPRAVAAGALIGLAALVRPTALLLLPVAMGAFLLSRGRERGASLRRRALLAAAAAATAFLLILPATLANRRATGTALLVQGHGGFNFWVGNSPARDGLPSVRPGAGWDRLEAEATRAGFVRAGDQDRYFVRKTLGEIRGAPLRWAGLLWSKLVWTLQAEEVRDPFSFRFFQREAWVLRMLPGLGVVLPLALAGAVAAARRAPRPWILYGAAAAWIAAGVFLVASFRYRLPLLPVLAVFAGVGLLESVRAVRAGPREAVAAIAILLAGIVLAHLRRHEPSRRFAEEWSATGFALNHERDLDGAERAFRSALAADPSWSPSWAGLGVVSANRGRLVEARENLQKAAALEPGSILANLELARLSARGGRWEDAEREYRKVLDVAPREPAALEGLGSMLLTRRRPEDAEAFLRRAADVAPRSASVRLLLARALGALRRWPKAIREAALAGDLDPSSGEAWLTLAMLRIDGGFAAGALEPLDRAQRAGADPRSVGLGRARALASLGDRSGALDALRRVLAIDPAFPPALRMARELEATAPR